MIREAKNEDLPQILEVYLHLHETAVPEESEELRCAWEKIVSDDDHHLIVCEVDGKIVSSCVCVIIPNLTCGGVPTPLWRMWSHIPITVERATLPPV